ncbi:MAG: hypothetical protein QM785_12375 [Pyrinomonadaceae bacterium]
MDIETPEIEQTESPAKQRNSKRQPKTDRRIWVYEVVGGKNVECGSFPEATVGHHVERRLPAFVQEMYGPGEYKVDIRTPKGALEKTFPITIADQQDENIIDVDYNDVEQDLEADHPTGFQHQQPPVSGFSPLEYENMMLKAQLQNSEQQRQAGAANDQFMLTMLQNSWEQQRQFMAQQIEMLRSASSQPREDPMAMMERAFNMVSKARDFTESVTPSESSGESSWLADGAKLVDSLGKTVGPAIPAIVSMLAQPAVQPTPQPYQPQQYQPQPSPVTAPISDISDIAARAKAARNGNGKPPAAEKEQNA